MPCHRANLITSSKHLSVLFVTVLEHGHLFLVVSVVFGFLALLGFLILLSSLLIVILAHFCVGFQLLLKGFFTSELLVE